MDLEQIIQSFEEKINIIKLKKIDVIFSKLNPDQNDIIYLRNLDSLAQFMPEEADDLLKFFNTFSKQTGKTQMSRKYFYMNMMAAAQQNKFNINKMLYDDDINEIQKSLQNIRLKNRMQNSQINQKNQIQQAQMSTNCSNISQNYYQAQNQKEDLYESNSSSNTNLPKAQMNNFKDQKLQSQQQNNIQQVQQLNEQLSTFQNYAANTDKTNQSFNQVATTSVSCNTNFLNNISSVQTTNVSYIKNDDNQVIPHIEISLKNAISTPMIPDQGVKDQYLISQESSVQKTLYTIKENQFSANKANNNSFCNISAIQNVSQVESAIMSQEDQENQKYQMNKRQEIQKLNFTKNKQQNSSNPSRYINSKSNKQSQSSERNNQLKKNQQNSQFLLKDNININNVQLINNSNNNNNNFQNSTKSSLQQSIYEQVLKQKKPEQNMIQQQSCSQPGIVSTSIHQDSLIRIISRDKIIKDFKENFRGKQNFCDDFMELESTIRRLEKTNQSPTNSQLNKTAQHETTANCETQLQNLNLKQQANQNSYQFFSNEQKNFNQIQINHNLLNNQKEYTPKVLKNISNPNSNIKKSKENQDFSNSKKKNINKSLSNSKISKSSSKNQDLSQKDNASTKNPINQNVRRVARSTSANIIDKNRNQSKSPSQEKNNSKQIISRKISSDQILSYLKEKERSLSHGRREEKTPIKFLDFKQKQIQNQQNNLKSKKIKQDDQDKENKIEKLTHPRVYSSVSLNKENDHYQQVLKNSQIQNLHQNEQAVIKINQNQTNIQQQRQPAVPRLNSSSNQIKQSLSIERVKKLSGYQEQFNKKKQQQQVRPSRNQSISIAQVSSQENSICGQKKLPDVVQNQQKQFPDKVTIPNFLIKEANSCEVIQLDEENSLKNEKKIYQFNQSPQYQQYFEKIIMQDEKISKYFTTQNDDENSQYINYQTTQNNHNQSDLISKKQSQQSSKMSDHSTLREQKFEALEPLTLDQDLTSVDLKDKKSSHREQKNKHETLYNLIINEDAYQSKYDQENSQIQQVNNSNYENKQIQSNQFAPQFGGYNNNYNSNQSQQNNQQKSFLDSPSQFLEVLKTKIEEDENNEFLQIQMENLKKIQQEKQKLIYEEAQMLQQLQKSQLAKVSSRNSLSNSVQSSLSVNKQSQIQSGIYGNLKQSQDKILPGLPLPQKQNLSQQQQQLRSSYYSNTNNKSLNYQNQLQNNYQSQKNIYQNKQSFILDANSEGLECHNAKDVQSIIFQNSNYNSLSSQRDVQQGSIDSGYNYASNAAQKYNANSNSQQSAQQNKQSQMDFQNFYQKQQIESNINLNSQPISSYPNNHNSSLNFSFTDS